MKKATTADMEIAVTRLIEGRKHIILPNASWGILSRHEADLLVIEATTRRHYVTEIEIKVSVSDFRAEAKKNHKHTHALISRLIYAMPDYVYEKVKDEIPADKRVGVIVATFNESRGWVAKWVKTGTHVLPYNHRKPEEKDYIQIAKLLSLRLWDQKFKVKSLNNVIKHMREQK